MGIRVHPLCWICVEMFGNLSLFDVIWKNCTKNYSEAEKVNYLILTNHSYMLWQFRKELIDKLAETGDVVISTPFVGHEEDFKKKYRCVETKIDRRGINPVKDLMLYSFYIKLLKTERPDMVITYSIKPNIYGGYACRKLGIPYCVNIQGLGTAFQKEPMATIVSQMYRVALNGAKCVFFENRANAEEFVRRRIVKEEKITVLNGAGVNLEEYTYQPYPDESDGIHFLYLGRIMKEKGIDELLEAIKSIKNKYGNKVKFDFVGFYDDDYKEKIEKMVEEGLIVFHGFKADPKPYYTRSHCVVLPSYHEGMSNVLLEAAATGRTIICSDIPGCREAVDNGITGFLCEKGSPESLERTIDKVVLLNRTEREAMGRRGRSKMEREFDKNFVVVKTADCIKLI